MLKNKKSFVSIRLIVAIIVIVIIVCIGINNILGLLKKEKIEDFQSDILLVQSKVELVKGNHDMDKEGYALKGIQLSQLPEDIDINEFKNKNIISEEEYEKYYLLNSTALEECGLGEMANRYEGYFIVNYENYEVVYSKGYENENGLWCFKISEMNKVQTPINQKSIEASAEVEQNQENNNDNLNNEENQNSCYIKLINNIKENFRVLKENIHEFNDYNEEG